MPDLSIRTAVAACAFALLAASCGGSDAATDTTDPDVSDSADTNADDASADGSSEADAAADDAEQADDASGDGDVAEQTADVQISGERLEAMPRQPSVTDADTDPAVGLVAPEVTGTSFDGSTVSIAADGTPRVIMFVAHWCPHCQREVPVVKALIDDGAVPDGVEIVVVSTAAEPDQNNFPPQAWLDAEGWEGPILRDSDESEVVRAFGAGGFPFTVYLDSEHRVVARSAGELPEDVLRQLWLATAEA